MNIEAPYIMLKQYCGSNWNISLIDLCQHFLGMQYTCIRIHGKWRKKFPSIIFFFFFFLPSPYPPFMCFLTIQLITLHCFQSKPPPVSLYFRYNNLCNYYFYYSTDIIICLNWEYIFYFGKKLGLRNPGYLQHPKGECL